MIRIENKLLIDANQAAIKQLGNELQNLREAFERDRKDKWQFMSDLLKFVEKQTGKNPELAKQLNEAKHGKK